MLKLPFHDRSEAGRLLGAELATRKFSKNTVVLALTRGGVPVGVEVAEALKIQLDIVVVRKLGVPWQPELAMGAIAGEARVLHHDLTRHLGIAEIDVEIEIAKQTEEMRRREKLYREDVPAVDLVGRDVVIVDGGLATGSTMIAAIRHVRGLRPNRIVVAIPVGSLEGCRRASIEADECICLAQPRQFFAVGEWYVHFPQVRDCEVRDLLKHRNTSIASVE